jgi:hypothetical protein
VHCAAAQCVLNAVSDTLIGQTKEVPIREDLKHAGEIEEILTLGRREDQPYASRKSELMCRDLRRDPVGPSNPSEKR